MTGEEWVDAAMADDSMVVELLLGLCQTAKRRPAFPLEWRVRQRRSKPVTVSSKKPATRDSPNTPLSWSGGTSGSGGAVDGAHEEECSRPPSASDLTRNARSKVNESSEKTTAKRSRKKKTLAELRQDEVMLLKERRQLKKELAKLRFNFEKLRATNENMKRMKTHLPPQRQNEGVETAETRQEVRVVLPDLNLPLEDDSALNALYGRS